MAITNDTRMHRAAERTGIGLRLPHITEVVATRPPVGWLEIHPENFLANPHAIELLTDLARDYPISVHTVGVSIGSADGIDLTHLRRLRDLVDRVDPVLVSGDGRAHLCPICVRDIDAPFVDAYWDAVSKVAEMEDLVAHFLPEQGVIERGRRED